MINRIRHRGLRRFHRRGDASGLTPHEVPRIRRILTSLDQATSPADMDFPGLRLHSLRGDLDGYWAITVTGSRRMIFRIEDGQPTDVDLVNYH